MSLLGSRLIALTGFVASIVILAGGLVLFWAKRRREQYVGPRPWHLLCAAIFASILSLELSQTFCGISPSDTPVLSSLFSTVQMFLLERDMDVDSSAVYSMLSGFAHPYLIYNSFLFLLAPFTTLGAALVLLSQYASLPLLRLMSRTREAFLFSHLTEDALQLARSIADADERYLIAFSDMDSCEDEDLVSEARALPFLCFSQSVSDLLRWCHANAHLHLILSSLNEEENLHDALVLAEQVSAPDQNRGEVTIHIVSHTVQASSFVDAVAHKARNSATHIRVRRINENSDLVEHMLMQYPLFLPGMPTEVSPSPYEHDHGHVVIVGHDELCYEYLKGTLWCGRADGLRVRVTLLDEQATRLTQRLAFDCPELYGLRDTEYSLECLDLAIESEHVLAYLQQNAQGITHVLVSCGRDLESVRVARRMREILTQGNTCADEKTRITAFVLTHIDDPVLAGALGAAQSPDGQPYDLTGIGSRDTVLSYRNVFGSTLERWARNLNRAHWGYYDLPGGPERDELGRTADAAFETSEYSRTSSMASAIFLKHDLFSFCRHLRDYPQESSGLTELPGADDWCRPLDDPRLCPTIEAYAAYVSTHRIDWLQRLEHDRWAAYARSLGFECASEVQYEAFFGMTGRNQYQLARLHTCLVSYDCLDEVGRMAERVEKRPPKLPFTEVDRVVIAHLKEIVYDGKEQ